MDKIQSISYEINGKKHHYQVGEGNLFPFSNEETTVDKIVEKEPNICGRVFMIFSHGYPLHSAVVHNVDVVYA